jgi:hypothetical protein
MIDLLALALVLLTGLYLIGLGAVSLFAPARATFFLEGFASSARAHYVELVLRLGAGVALVTYAPRMRFSAAFALGGWVLVVTAAALLVVPWRWHHRFARWAVPQAIPHLRLIAAASFLFGSFVLACVILGDLVRIEQG